MGAWVLINDRWYNAANHYQKNHDILLIYCRKKNSHCLNRQFEEGAESTRIDYERGYRRHKPKGISQLLVYDKIKAVDAIKKAEIEGCKIVYREGKTKVALSDVWKLPIIGSTSKERLGYPTQKPLALLDRIIKVSSNEGDIVFDPFCGCATALVAADRLQRQWIGVDLSQLAAKLVNKRLRDDSPGQDSNIRKLFFDIQHRTDIPRRTDLGDLPNYRTHRHMLYGRQEGLCKGCQVMFPFRNMTVDHIVAQSKGGSDHMDNLQLLCGACNSTKGARSQEEFIVRLTEQGMR